MKKLKTTSAKSEKTKSVFYVDLLNNDIDGKKRKQKEKDQRFARKEAKKVNAIKSEAGAKHYAHNAMRMKKGRVRDLIMMFAATIKVIKGKLGMPRGDADYLKKSVDMQAAQVTNTLGYFTVPFDGLAQWKTENIALDAALSAITNGVRGGEGMKVTALVDLKITLNLALAYVNKLAALDQKHAVSIIEAALMTVIKSGKRNKPDFEVLQMEATGDIELISLAGTYDNKRVTTIYEWAYSIDNGKTWEPLNPTLVSKTIASEMGVGLETIFRKRTTTTKGGTSKWVVSEPITPK